jgi:threonine dehydratase
MSLLKRSVFNHNLISKCNYINPAESVLNGFMASIGNTPLIKLEKISKESGCNILVKCEYMNPGGMKEPD